MTKPFPMPRPVSEIFDTPELHGEIRELLSYVHGLREDFASLAPVNIPGSNLAQARNELGAVVTTTETAANKILDACQTFDAAVHGGPLGPDPKLIDALNAIYEACSFQDLTSQRVVKVQKMLGFVEDKLQGLLAKLGISAEDLSAASPGDTDDAAALLNGPAMPGQGIDQTDIDSLFG